MFEALQSKVDDAIFQEIFTSVTPDAHQSMLVSISGHGDCPSLSNFKAGAGRVGLKAFNILAARLRFLQSLGIDKLNLENTPRSWRENIYRRTASLPPSNISRMTPARQVGLYAVYLHELMPDLIDALIDALIKAVNKFERGADNSVKGVVSRNIETVYDRDRLLATIAAGWLEHRKTGAQMNVDEFMQQFMDVSEAEVLAAKSGKSTWAEDMFERMRASWTSYYRGMLKEVLQILEFHTSFSAFDPLLRGLDWVHLNWDNRGRIDPIREGVPIEGIIPKKYISCLLYTSPSPRDRQKSRMPSSA